jgi:hypothetical protein
MAGNPPKKKASTARTNSTINPARVKASMNQITTEFGSGVGAIIDGMLGDLRKGFRANASDASKEFSKSAEEIIKSAANAFSSIADIGTSEYKKIDFKAKIADAAEKERQAAMGILTVEGMSAEEAAKMYRTQKEAYKGLQAEADVHNRRHDLIMQGNAGMEAFKQTLIESVSKAKIFLTSWAGVAAGTVALNKYLGEMSKTLGVSVGQSTQMVHQNALLGPMFKMFGLDVQASQKALIDNFQNMSDVTLENVGRMGLLQLQTGLSADQAGKASRMFSLIEGSTAAAGMNMTKQVTTQAELAGAVPAKVIEDMTANSAQIAEYWAGNVESLTATAIQASKLGLSISNITTAAGKMLDIESSIAAEMEAEVLLGKQLNLDKAREAALMGDSETLMKELVKNAGSLEQFNSMNVIQRQKLAAALGIGVGELQKMVQEQDSLSTTSGQIAAAWSKWGPIVTTTGPALAKAANQAFKLKDNLMNLPWGKLGSMFKKGSSGAADAAASTAATTGGAAAQKGGSAMVKTGSAAGGAATSMLKGAAAMLIMGAALWVAAKGFQELAKVDWGALWPGAVIALIALAGAMAIMGVMAPLLLWGAAAFAGMSVALLLFGVALMAVGKGIQLTKGGLTGFASIIKEIMPLVPGLFALGAAFGIMGIGLISLSAGLIALVPALPVIMALGAMATLALAMSGAGGGAEGEVMEMKSTSIEDKLDALTLAILAQPITIEVDGKAVGRGIRMAHTQTTIDMA